MAELVADKERANFCEFFRPEKNSGAAPRPANPRKALDDLFRKK